ncbi:MAG: hypothetical protein IJE91_01045 [Clostridia bacterium]|nr:hypothetical protein [Clostridia bacterium]
MNKKEILALDLFATSASGKCHSYERYLEELRGHVANTAYSKAYSLAFEAIFNDKQLYQLWKDGVEVHQDALRRCFEQIEQGVHIPEEYIQTEVAARNSGIAKLREVLAPVLEQRLADRISKMGHKSSVDRIETTKKLQEKGISLLEKYGLTPLMINMMRKKYHADTQKAYIELCNKQQDNPNGKKRSKRALYDDAEDIAYFQMRDNVIAHFKQNKQVITEDEAMYVANVLCTIDRLEQVQNQLASAKTDIKNLGSKAYIRTILDSTSTTPRADAYLDQLFTDLYSSANPYLNDEQRKKIITEVNRILKERKNSPLTYRFEPIETPVATKGATPTTPSSGEKGM